MAGIPWFYLGPLGGMAALPSPSPGLDNGLKKVAGQHVSLNAHTTEDVQGYRREWTLELPYLEADDVGFLEACFAGVIPGPLRLLDPTRRNRLSLAASATQLNPAWPNGTTAAAVTAGVLTVEQTPAWPAIGYTADDGRTVSYVGGRVLSWVVSAAGALTLDAGPGVVALPGETVTASAYVRTTGAGSATLALVPRTAAGDGTPVVGTSGTGGAWTRLTVTYSVPDGVLAVVPRVTAGTTAGTVTVAAAQVEAADAASGWVPGTGCPEVLVTELPAKSPLYPLVSAGLSLREV